MCGYQYKEQRLTLKPNQRLFIYTDGGSESQDKDGNLYGRNHIEMALNSLALGDDNEVIKGMHDSLKEYSSGREQYDDICMMSLTYLDKTEFLVNEEADLEKIPDFVQKKLGDYLKKDEISTICVIMDELISNAIFYGENKSGNITIELTYDQAEGVKGIIRDQGRPFNPLKEAPKRKEGQIGGLGIIISKGLTTSMSYERVGSSNVLTFYKK
jgi:sigma-B regulation protein RsbU (phosphoserine phosphatase)